MRTGIRKWSVAWICSFINFLYLGVPRLSGMFYLAAISRYNVNRNQAALPFVLCYTVRNVAGPFIGCLSKKVNVETLILCGCILSSVGVGVCFFAEDITTVSVLWGGIFGLGFGLSTILIPSVLNQHFDKYISNANGIAFGGECIAGFVLPPLYEFCLNTFGLSGSFLILAGLLLHGIPAAMFLKPPDRRTATADGDPSESNPNSEHIGHKCDSWTDCNKSTPKVEKVHEGKSLLDGAKNHYGTSIIVKTKRTKRDTELGSSYESSSSSQDDSNLVPKNQSSSSRYVLFSNENSPNSKLSSCTRNSGATINPSDTTDSIHDSGDKLNVILSNGDSLITNNICEGACGLIPTNEKIAFEASQKELSEGDEHVILYNGAPETYQKPVSYKKKPCESPEFFSNNENIPPEDPKEDEKYESSENLKPSSIRNPCDKPDIKLFSQYIQQEDSKTKDPYKYRHCNEASQISKLPCHKSSSISPGFTPSLGKTHYDVSQDIRYNSDGHSKESTTIHPITQKSDLKIHPLSSQISKTKETGRYGKVSQNSELFVRRSPGPSCKKNQESVFQDSNEPNAIPHQSILPNNCPPDSEQDSKRPCCCTPTFAVFCDPAFLLILFTQSSAIFVATTFTTILVDFSIDAGVAAPLTVYVLMCFSAADMAGRFGLGWVTDGAWLSGVAFSASCYGVMGAVLLSAPVLLKGLGLVLAAVGVYGVVLGGLVVIGPVVVTEHVEKEVVNIALASRFALFAPMSLVQSSMIGYFRDTLGSYNGIFYLLGLHCVVCAILSLFIPLAANCRKQRFQERVATEENF